MSLRRARISSLLVLGGLVAASVACDRPPPASLAEPAAVALRVGGAPALRETIERHRGKVVLVDFWATWCGPCMKQFPHTVALFREHASRGLTAVSVSLDDLAQEEKVVDFLRRQGAAFDNILSHRGIGAETVEEFGLRGDIPLYRLHDRSGTLRYQFSAEPEGLERGEPIDRMDTRVRELLDER